MFNLGFSELILLGIIALICIGPQQLPELARNLGRLLNELKRASDDFQESFTTPIKEDLQTRLHEARNHLSTNVNSEPPSATESLDLPTGVKPIVEEVKKS